MQYPANDRNQGQERLPADGEELRGSARLTKLKVPSRSHRTPANARLSARPRCRLRVAPTRTTGRQNVVAKEVCRNRQVVQAVSGFSGTEGRQAARGRGPPSCADFEIWKQDNALNLAGGSVGAKTAAICGIPSAVWDVLSGRIWRSLRYHGCYHALHDADATPCQAVGPGNGLLRRCRVSCDGSSTGRSCSDQRGG